MKTCLPRSRGRNQSSGFPRAEQLQRHQQGYGLRPSCNMALGGNCLSLRFGTQRFDQANSQTDKL
ncbi:MAG TPA: hypothetical protein PKY91_03935 [Rhodocyclaceae bacterium]|nr:hypothetical protein [Rhodocyclaceae bacterium]